MQDEPVLGALHIAREPGQPPEVVAFASLQDLLDLCERHRGLALVRVELRGKTAGSPRRLVLDFGQFSAWPE